MKIIAFAGFIGCGKNTTSAFLTEQRGYRAFAYADALKDTVAAIFCWPREMIEGNTLESRKWREMVDPYWAEQLGIPNLTPRWALQHIGTQVMRDHFDERIWILNVQKRILSLGPKAKAVVTDARFPNELDLVRDMGGKVVRVRRDDEPEWYDIALAANGGDQDALYTMISDFGDVHESEWKWIGYPFDVVIENNGSIDDLHHKTGLLLK